MTELDPPGFLASLRSAVISLLIPINYITYNLYMLAWSGLLVLFFASRRDPCDGRSDALDVDICRRTRLAVFAVNTCPRERKLTTLTRPVTVVIPSSA